MVVTFLKTLLGAREMPLEVSASMDKSAIAALRRFQTLKRRTAVHPTPVSAHTMPTCRVKVCGAVLKRRLAIVRMIVAVR